MTVRVSLAPAEHVRAAREASERILAAIKDIDETALEGGPYRSLGQPRLPEGSVVDESSRT
jgi:hypothetical protein